MSKVCRIGQISRFIVSIGMSSNKLCMSDTELDNLEFCIESECGHWIELYPITKREDHSGGQEAIFEYGRKTNRTPRREGPSGSLGHWILDASGYCGFGGKP